MAEMAKANVQVTLPSNAGRTNAPVHTAWLRLMRYCAEMGHGEIEKLKIQDGLPMAAEVTTKKIKFCP